MLSIIIPKTDLWDESKEVFTTFNEKKINLEHSLLSISKWEAKYMKPFLNDVKKTDEELLDYIFYMCLTPNVDKSVFKLLSKDNIDSITNYISHPATATTINDRRKQEKKQIITSELIYSYMVSFGIPFTCEKWHINRLLTLIKICDIQNDTNNKMSNSEILKSNRAINAARRAKYRGKG